MNRFKKELHRRGVRWDGENVIVNSEECYIRERTYEGWTFTHLNNKFEIIDIPDR